MLLFNGQPVKTGKFPNQETYVDIPNLNDFGKNDPQVVTMRFEGNDDIINLVLFVSHLQELGFKNLELESPFFPYSTMDHTDKGKTRPLSLRYIADIINGLNFERVTIWEPHSAVTSALVRHLIEKEGTIQVEKRAEEDLLAEGFRPEEIILVCPDNGAFKRYRGRFPGHRVVVLDKVRDFSTGDFAGETIIVGGEQFLENAKAAIIIDDLCRAGRTFINAGELLRGRGITRVVLAVTHLENTAYDVMEAGKLSILTAPEVDDVYATDSCYTRPLVEKIHILNCEET